MRTVSCRWLGVLLSLASWGCVHELTPLQKRAITTRSFEGSPEMVFRATLAVLQDEGYSIKNADMESGLVFASMSQEANSLIRKLAALSLVTAEAGLMIGDDLEEGDSMVVPGRKDIEISGIVTGMDPGVTELRMTIHEVEHVTVHKYGQDEIEARSEPEAVYDLKRYELLFAAIHSEVERRKVGGARSGSPMQRGRLR